MAAEMEPTERRVAVIGEVNEEGVVTFYGQEPTWPGVPLEDVERLRAWREERDR